MFSRKISLCVVVVLLLLLCMVGVTVGYTDNYSFNISSSSGEQTFSLDKWYDYNYVTSMNGTLIPNTGSRSREFTLTAVNQTRSDSIELIYVPWETGMRSNYSDLRFEYVNGTPIQYYIALYESTQAIVFLKVNMSQGDNTFVMSYGDNNTTSLSNKTGMFLADVGEELDWEPLTNNYSKTISYNTLYCDYLVFKGDMSGSVEKIQVRTDEYGNGSLHLHENMFIGYSMYTFEVVGQSYMYEIEEGDYRTPYFNFRTGVANNTPYYQVWGYLQNEGTEEIKMGHGSAFDFFNILNIYANSTHPIEYSDILAYNSTNANITWGNVTTKEPIPLILTPKTTPTFNQTVADIPVTGGGILNFTINYTPHITNWSVLPNQPAGTLNFSFKPNPTTAFFTWQVSDTPFFTNIITSGSTSGAVINGTGFVNMNITDYTNLTSGQYYLRLKSGDASNNTVFAMNEVNISDTVSLTFHLVDGVTGDLIAPPLTGNTTLFPSVSIGNTTANTTYTSLVRNWLISTNAVSIVSGSSVQNRSVYTNNSTNTRAIFTVNNLTIGQPVILSFTAASNYTPQNYTITPTSEMLNLPYLELAIARGTVGIANNTYGIVHDEYGRPIQNGSVIIKNATTGNIIQAYPIMAGGQYAYNNTNTTGGNHFTFSAEGFQQVSGILGSGKQDILMPRAHNISIRLFDADSAAPIMRFTTYLGDSQIIRSTDSGVVTYSNVSSGSYQVILQADGYTQVSRQINVSDYQKTFNITISKTENITVWDEPNYVTFNIIDQFGESVRNADVAVQTLDGRTIFSRTLEGSSSFVVELNRTTNYKITVSKQSENIYQTLTIYGSSLSAYMYISVSRSVQGALDLFNGTYISFDAPKNQFIVTATATDSRITDLYFTETDVKYSIQGSATNGSLGAPTITKPSANTIVATWNISDLYQNGGVILSSNITIGSNQTGNQTMRVKNVMLARENGTGDQSLKLDLGIDKETMQWISIFIIIATALITSSAGIPYLSTLAPIVVYYILWWAGWITLPTGVVVLFAIGLIVVAYDMIKKSKM